MFRLERRDKILVPEFRLRSIGGDVMGKLRRPCLIHIARVPFVAKRRNRVDSPVEEDAELGVLIPSGNLVLLQRIPIGAEWSSLSASIDLAEKRGARGVELVGGLFPQHVIRVGSLGRSGDDGAKQEYCVESHVCTDRTITFT